MGESWLQVGEFKCLSVLFTSDGRMKPEMDGQIGLLSLVMGALLWLVVVKNELS